MADSAPAAVSGSPAPRPAEVTPLPRPERAAPPAEPAAQGGAGRWLRAALRLVLLVAVPVGGAVVGVGYWLEGGRFVATDNAYIRADKVAVAAEVKGRLVEVTASSNDRVAWGDVLFRLDDEPFRVALEEAEARLAMVRTEIAVLRAQYRRVQEQLALARTDVDYYAREFDRQSALAERRVVAAARIDEARHDLARARQAVLVAERELGEVLAKLGGNPETPDERFARYNNARARRDRAALALANTVVRAPADGIVARVPIRPGSYIEAGDPAMIVVETAGIWLEANLKESEIAHVALGQPATMTVDAWPDREWQARVKSFSPATGAEFSLLPPQNATGNWVKVVQRVPVRFHVEVRPGDPPLRAGMSATVSIDTGHERALPGFARTALAWIDGALEGALKDPPPAP